MTLEEVVEPLAVRLRINTRDFGLIVREALQEGLPMLSRVIFLLRRKKKEQETHAASNDTR